MSFPRKSSFDAEAYARKEWQDRLLERDRQITSGEARVNEAASRTVTKQDGPSKRDLERWYQALRDICARESDGDVDHSTELEDLKDEIYAYLD